VNTRLTKEAILDLLSEGAELWYLYLDGGVAVHQHGKPTGGICPIEVFLDLRERQVIERDRRNDTGYPFYANHSKSEVYKLKP